jgi:uncharacterized protein
VNLFIEPILIGLLGSLHCVGMCGPIAISIPFSGENKIAGMLSYNIGRVITYGLMGIVVWLFGEAIPFGTFQRPLTIAIGVVLLLAVFLPKLKNVGFLGRYYVQFNSWVIGKMKQRISMQSTLSKFIFGMLNGMLPCGMVFIALSFSLLSDAPPLFMLLFGLGTVPSMFLLPFIANYKPAIRQKISGAFPYLMVVFGLLFILRGMNLDIPYISPKYSDNNTEVASCCSKKQSCEKK